MHKRTIGIVYNPNSGRGKAKKIFGKISQILESQFEIIGISGKSESETRNNLSSYLDTLEAVISIGGDGLVNLVIQELALTKKPVFVIPAGTGNDFYRHNFKDSFQDIKSIQDLNLDLKTSIDLVKVDFQSNSRYFGQILSAGFDSLVNARANQLRYLPGSLKYVLALLLEIFSFKPYQYSLEIDGILEEFEAMMVVLANGPTYGGGMKVLPKADAKDGVLDILILNPVSKFELLRVFPRVFSGKHVTHPKVDIRQCTSVKIDCEAPIYADGEYFGSGKISAAIAPKSLYLVSLP